MSRMNLHVNLNTDESFVSQFSRGGSHGLRILPDGECVSFLLAEVKDPESETAWNIYDPKNGFQSGDPPRVFSELRVLWVDGVVNESTKVWREGSSRKFLFVSSC